jgi:hypothetical protein
VAEQSSQNCSGASSAFVSVRYSTSTRAGLNDIGLSVVLSAVKNHKKLFLLRVDRSSAHIVT